MGKLINGEGLKMSDSFMKTFWFKHAPKLLLRYWIGVAVYCFFVKPDPVFVYIQICSSLALIFGHMTGYHEGIKDRSTAALKRVEEMERDYTITFTRRDKDE